MSIPLLVGEARAMKDGEGTHCVAIDVVLNPFCIEKSGVDNMFKCQCVDLALEWINKETEGGKLPVEEIPQFAGRTSMVMPKQYVYSSNSSNTNRIVLCSFGLETGLI